MLAPHCHNRSCRSLGAWLFVILLLEILISKQMVPIISFFQIFLSSLGLIQLKLHTYKASYNTSQLFCFEHTVLWNKSIEIQLHRKIRLNCPKHESMKLHPKLQKVILEKDLRKRKRRVPTSSFIPWWAIAKVESNFRLPLNSYKRFRITMIMYIAWSYSVSKGIE